MTTTYHEHSTDDHFEKSRRTLPPQDVTVPARLGAASAHKLLPLCEGVTLLVFGERLNHEALARRQGCYRSPESSYPQDVEAEAEKLAAGLKLIGGTAAAKTMAIFGRPGRSDGTRDPEWFGDYAEIPSAVFCGSPEFHLGWPPFPIIQAGDNIYRARWFFPLIGERDILALRKKFFELDRAIESTARLPRAARGAVERFVRRYVQSEGIAGRAPSQLGLERAAREADVKASREQLRRELSRYVMARRGAPKKPAVQFAEK